MFILSELGVILSLIRFLSLLFVLKATSTSLFANSFVNSIYFTHLNRIHKNLNENTKSINFLNVIITRNNSQLLTKIYRRPTTNDLMSSYNTFNKLLNNADAAINSQFGLMLSACVFQSCYKTWSSTLCLTLTYMLQSLINRSHIIQHEKGMNNQEVSKHNQESGSTLFIK